MNVLKWKLGNFTTNFKNCNVITKLVRSFCIYIYIYYIRIKFSLSFSLFDLLATFSYYYSELERFHQRTQELQTKNETLEKTLKLVEDHNNRLKTTNEILVHNLETKDKETNRVCERPYFSCSFKEGNRRNLPSFLTEISRIKNRKFSVKTTISLS